MPPVSKLAVSVATPGIPTVAKPFLLYAIDPSSIGNLLKNGDFEDGAASWGGKYAMGLKAGQLAKDSSVYQVNFRREGAKTIYDVGIPWSEIPGFAPAKGASFGCNLVLIDADEGAGRGRMVWGADLGETASGCGVVTLLP